MGENTPNLVTLLMIKNASVYILGGISTNSSGRPDYLKLYHVLTVHGVISDGDSRRRKKFKIQNLKKLKVGHADQISIQFVEILLGAIVILQVV
jgi:hypothetical protein